MKEMQRAVIWKRRQTSRCLYTNKCRQKAPHTFCQLWGHLQFHARDALRRGDDLRCFMYNSKGHTLKCPTVTGRGRWDTLCGSICGAPPQPHTLPLFLAFSTGAGTFSAFTLCFWSGFCFVTQMSFLGHCFSNRIQSSLVRDGQREGEIDRLVILKAACQGLCFVAK